jgi:outer membrane autotransporter protein
MMNMNKILPSLIVFFGATVLLHAQNSETVPSYVSDGEAGLQALSSFSDFASSQLLSKGGFGVELGYQALETDPAKNRFYDGDADSMTASLGYTWASETINLGVFLSYVSSDTEIEANSNADVRDSDGDGFFIGAGLGKKWEKLNLVAQGGFGQMSSDSDRTTVFGTKTADYDTDFFYLSVGLSYDLYTSESSALTPFLNLGYQSSQTDDIQESAGPDAANVNSFEDDVPYVQVGVMFEYMPDSDFSPYASVAFWSDLGDEGVDVDGTAGVPFAVEVEDVMSQVIEAEIGFDWTLSERASLNAGVKYFSASEADGYAFTIGTDFSF